MNDDTFKLATLYLKEKYCLNDHEIQIFNIEREKLSKTQTILQNRNNKS